MAYFSLLLLPENKNRIQINENKAEKLHELLAIHRVFFKSGSIGLASGLNEDRLIGIYFSPPVQF